MVDDAIALGASDDKFDDTVLRLSQDLCGSSVEDAVQALIEEKAICNEGMCIVFSSSDEQYFMLVRSDKKEKGLRVFHDFTEDLSTRPAAARLATIFTHNCCEDLDRDSS